MNLPTKITVFRILIVPVIWAVLLIPIPDFLKYLLAFILFVVASISDFLDGYLARKYNLITSLGKFLDPIADKVLVNTLMVFLAFHHRIPVLCVVLMISRDTLVDAMRMNASNQGIVVSAKLLGKLKTVLQMVALSVALFPFYFSTVTESLIWIATIASLISGVDYFISLKDKIF